MNGGGLFALAAVVFWLFAKRKPAQIMSQAPKPFRLAFAEAAARANLYGLPADFCRPVADAETATGTSSALAKSRNLFSVHKDAGLGQVTPYWSGEVYTTARGEVLRVYKSWEDSISDFCLLLTSRPKWAPAVAAARAGDFEGFAVALQDAGYAGNSTTYARLLRSRL